MATPLGLRPTVSVVVPVWNVEPYLEQCLESALSQSIGPGAVEVIAVDDGSTDRSGEILDEFARRHRNLRVIHQANSGGPGSPRNVGLDRSTGEHVFFLDADDYLAPEALERLVAMARRNRSDIVLGRIESLDGRAHRRREAIVFDRDVDHADLEVVYPCGNVQKLFRRGFLVGSGQRFAPGVPGGEDGDFMAALYLKARVISIVGTYACLYVRKRAGSQTVRADRTDDLGAYLLRVELERIVRAAATRKPGVQRDFLIAPHVARVIDLLGGRWLRLESPERRRVFDIGRGIVRRWSTRPIRWALPPRTALKAYCLEHGLQAELEDVVACRGSAAFADPVVEGRRIYARYPHFRDGSGIPDRCFEITSRIVVEACVEQVELSDEQLVVTGQAHLPFLGGTTTVALERWPAGARRPFTMTTVDSPQLRDTFVDYPQAGFRAVLDLGAGNSGHVPDGLWKIRLTVATDRVRRTATLCRTAPAFRGSLLVGSSDRFALDMGAGGEIRLRVGRVAPLVRLAATAERAALGARAGAMRIVMRLRLARLVVLGVRETHPALALRLFGR